MAPLTNGILLGAGVRYIVGMGMHPPQQQGKESGTQSVVAENRSMLPKLIASW
jgi:hypothetical protein